MARTKLPSERRKVFFANLVDKQINSIPCGECQLCCELIVVYELNKPPATKCQHQCAGGCAIYKEKPRSCTDYACMWKMGLLIGEDLRPDKINMIFDHDTTTTGRHWIRAWQVSPGQLLNTPSLLNITYKLSSKLNLPVVAFYNGVAVSIHLIKRFMFLENSRDAYGRLIYELKQEN